MIQFDQV